MNNQNVNNVPQEKSPVLELMAISHSYQTADGAIEAIRDINLSVDEHEFVCILGPSGCGKSTILNLLAGFFSPLAGQALIDGMPITKPDRNRGVMFQTDTLYPWMNVEDNITFGPRMRGAKSEECAAISQNYLSEVNLNTYGRKRVFELSGGMKQRVALARVLANEPRVILMDEPFAALDAVTRVQMQGLIRNIWHQEKRTIVMITHDIDEALSLGTRLVIMTRSPGTIEEIIETDFTITALNPPGQRVQITPEYIKLRDHIFQIIV
jgi:taurine transport system ATP-binding protein